MIRFGIVFTFQYVADEKIVLLKAFSLPPVPAPPIRVAKDGCRVYTAAGSIALFPASRWGRISAGGSANIQGVECIKPRKPSAAQDRSMNKPTLTVVGGSGDTTGTNTEAKTPRGRAYKGQPKTSGPKTPVNSEGLTAKQEAFCHAILGGKGWSDAYRDAYDAENMSAASVHREAFALATSPKIASRLERAEKERQAEQRMQRLSRAERVIEKLEGIGVRGDAADGTQVRALELLGKTLGLFVDRVETEDKTPRDADSIRAELEQRINRLMG